VSIYLYSLADAQLVAGQAWSPGIAGAPVRSVEIAALALIVSEIDRLPAPTRRVDLVGHNSVNLAVLETGACVPLRYGTMLPTLAEGQALIAAELERWHRALDDVRNRVELSVKVIVPPVPFQSPPEPIPNAGPGASYLLRRQAEEATDRAVAVRASAVAERVRERVDDLADRTRQAIHGRLVMVSVLLHGEVFDTATSRIQQLAAESEGRWSISPRWPPYSFVDNPKPAGGSTARHTSIQAFWPQREARLRGRGS
jgi:hypothetical protein